MVESKITREMITAFGDKLLNSKEVESIHINISFKDGSNIAFNKSRYDNEGEDDY